MPDNNSVILEARSWCGVKWQHQGRSRAGVDCAGVIVMVARALGLPVKDRTDYQRRTHGPQFLQHFKDNLPEKPITEIAPGDVLVFTEPSYPCHCGIVTEKHGTLYFVHGYAKRRKVIEEHLSEEWWRKIVGVFSWPGLEE